MSSLMIYLLLCGQSCIILCLLVAFFAVDSGQHAIDSAQ